MNVPHHLPLGYQLAGVACGLKTISTALDLGLVVSDRPAVAAGVFTQNQIFAAPVELDRQRTPSASIRAVIVNSGNANACTGRHGLEDAILTTDLVAAELNMASDRVLVLSTGIIGRRLDTAKVASGIRLVVPSLAASEQGIESFARAMMTTDLVPKIASRSIQIGDTTVRLLGFAKGSGMISPNMATMLGVLLTDAPLTVAAAQPMLQRAADRSFNAISVDGHTSTNDTVLLLANGAAAESKWGVEWDESTEGCFPRALQDMCIELAKAIVRDGEGANHLIEIRVMGTASDPQAIAIGRSIGNSPLVKTAVAGCDPNWGRIVSAAGYAGVLLDPQQVRLRVNGALLFEHGEPIPFDAVAVSESLRQNADVLIEMTVGAGPGKATCWTCDLTSEYVRINADYHT